MTIKQKIVGKSLATALLLAGVGVGSALSMSRIGDSLRDGVAVELRETSDADQLQGTAVDIERVTQRYIQAVHEHRQADALRLKTEVDGFFEAIGQLTSRLDETMRRQPPDLLHDVPDSRAESDERDRLERIEYQAHLSRGEWSELQSQENSGGVRTDPAIFAQFALGADTLLSDSQELEVLTKTHMSRAVQAADQRVTASVRILVATAIFALLLAVVLGMLVAMPLVARLARLRDGAVALGKGNLELRINVGTGDEIGVLATAFNEMAAGLRRSRDALRLSEERLRLALDAAQLGTFDFRPVTGELIWDAANKRIWGLAPDEEPDYALAIKRVHPEDAARIGRDVQQSLDPLGSGYFESEYRIIWPDGSVHWTIGRGRVHFEAEGMDRRAVRMVGVQIDVTDSKRAEEALAQSAERLRHAQQIGRIGDWEFEVATKRITWSDELFDLFELHLVEGPPSYEQLLAYFVPADSRRVDAATTKAIHTGESSALNVQLQLPSSGAPAFHHIIITAIKDQHGKVIRLCGTSQDITDRMKAERALQRAHEELEQRVEARTADLQNTNEALRQSETDLQCAKEAAEAANRAKSVVFNTALDAIVTIDTRGVITAWNLQAETMFRWDQTEVIGMRLDQTIIPKRHWDAHRREIEEFPKKGEGPLLSKLVEIVAIRRDGQEFPVEVAITPAWSDGDECTFTAFIRDITVRKQAEADLLQARDAAESASRAKSEFLANMSHEIRTPLNGVIGMTGLLLDTALDERQRRFAELIESSGASLADLINDILDFSKIEARKLEIESVDFDLYAAVEEVMELMLMKATQKGLDLACRTLPDVPRQVKGDSQRIKQILINLVNNAIKFTERGSISTHLTLQEHSPETVTVRFAITDTGIGIPADRMDRLFKSFSQVDASTTRSFGGTGLGLAISKQLAELMGGTIGVESTVGEGSVFWFTVKLALASPISPPLPGALVDSRGLRVLAVHGDVAMREILHTQLCSWKLEAALASSGNEALQMLIEGAGRAKPFDVAIIDSDLPDIDALQLGGEIKARCELSQTALLILLPMNRNVEPTKLRAAGFSGHLLEPVRQSRLYDSIVDAMHAAPQSERIAAKTASGAQNPSCHAGDGTRRARILIAEDNRVNQIVATEVLTKHGYSCDIVDNGSKAVTAVLAGGYDLVLMDCSMPVMDGFEATRQIRRAEMADFATAQRHMPIIALTANAIKGDRDRCLEAGMDDYVSKPLDPVLLVKSIQSQLAQSPQAPSSQPMNEGVAVTANTLRPNHPEETLPFAIEALLDRCMGNAETVTLILNEFEQQAVGDLEEIKRNLASGDGEATARIAHALKGASGILSAATLSGIALQLEQMGRSGVLTGADQLLDQLKNEVQRCIAYLPSARAAMATKTENCMRPKMKGGTR